MTDFASLVYEIVHRLVKRILVVPPVISNIEVAPVITQRPGVVEAGGTYAVKVLGPQKISLTWGDFIGGDAQRYTAQGFFDPSPEANAGPNRVVEAETASSLQGSGADRDGDGLALRPPPALRQAQAKQVRA